MVREADPPLHHRQILFSTNQIFHQNVLVSDRTDRQTDRQTDGQTDGQTDRRNKYVLGLPCFKKLSSEFIRSLIPIPDRIVDYYLQLKIQYFFLGSILNNLHVI